MIFIPSNDLRAAQNAKSMNDTSRKNGKSIKSHHYEQPIPYCSVAVIIFGSFNDSDYFLGVGITISSSSTLKCSLIISLFDAVL